MVKWVPNSSKMSWHYAHSFVFYKSYIYAYIPYIYSPLFIRSSMPIISMTLFTHLSMSIISIVYRCMVQLVTPCFRNALYRSCVYILSMCDECDDLYNHSWRRAWPESTFDHGCQIEVSLPEITLLSISERKLKTGWL